MKKTILLFSILLLLLSIETKAQYIFSVTPPSCSTCCDGTIVVTQTFCLYGAYLGGFNPALTLSSYTVNTLVYTGACCQTYTMTMHASWESCVNGTYDGTVSVCPLPTSITNNRNTVQDFTLFPNPTTGKCLLNLTGQKKITITDLYGKTVLVTSTAENEIDLTGLVPGLYFITINTNNYKKTYRQKVVLE